MIGKSRKLSVVLALVPLLCGCSTTNTVLLLHTNDMHDHLRPGLDGRGGVPYVVGYMRGVQAERRDVILVDAGDVINKGDMLPAITKGEAIYAAMRRARYDVIIPGNHCFRNGLDQLSRNAALTGAEMLCANGVMQDGSDFPFRAAKIIDVDGTKVGIIGFALPSLVPQRVSARSWNWTGQLRSWPRRRLRSTWKRIWLLQWGTQTAKPAHNSPGKSPPSTSSCQAIHMKYYTSQLC